VAVSVATVTSWVVVIGIPLLEYAASPRVPVLALHVSTEEPDAQRFRQAWHRWGRTFRWRW